MSDVAVLMEMFRDCAIVQPEVGNPASVVLRENAYAYEVRISGLPLDALVIKLDDVFSNEGIFKGLHGECKRADFVIFCESKQCIICIELKYTKDTWVEIVNQLKGADCFVEYCKCIGKQFWKKSHFLNGYHKRFVSIGNVALNKRQTIEKPLRKKHDLPERALKIIAPHRVMFNQLASVG